MKLRVLTRPLISRKKKKPTINKSRLFSKK